MLVLYKELTTFQEIATYLSETEIPVICANVAISCAIHDQNLDESMDITGKTTTNIDPQDFCKEQILGDYFCENTDHFDQYMAICFLKDNFFYVRKAYNLLTDDTSKNNFIALILFLLCPYTERFFTVTPPPDRPLDFPTDTLPQLKREKENLTANPRNLTLPLGQSLSDFAKLPFFLGKIGKLDCLTLNLCQGEKAPYFCVVTAKFQSIPKVEQTEENPPQEILPQPSLPQEEPPQLETPTIQSIPSETITSLPSFLENTPVFTEETPIVPPEEEKITSPEPTPQEAQLLQEMLAEVDVPKPIETEVIEIPEEIVDGTEILETYSEVPEILEPSEEVVAVTDILQPCEVVTESPESSEISQEVTEIVTPQEIPPTLSGIHIDEERLQRSLELLGTMEELVIYLHRQYPTEDPVCADLLNSMLSGVKTLRNTLS